MTRLITIATPFEALPSIIDQYVALGLADAKALLETDPFFAASPPMLAKALATIETKLRDENTKNIQRTWLQLHNGEESVQ